MIFHDGDPPGSAHAMITCGLYLSILRFKFVISFIRSFGGTWYMYILASICDFCTYRIKFCFELSPTLILPTCEQRRLCRDIVCAQVRKIYMKTELQCVLSRPCRDATYIIFSPPRFPKTGCRMVHYSEGFIGGSLYPPPPPL